MTLMIGYEEMGDADTGIKAGARFKSIGDAGTVPKGPAHAVEEGENVSICGEPVTDTGQPWPPPPFKKTCDDCLKLAPRA